MSETTLAKIESGYDIGCDEMRVLADQILKGATNNEQNVRFLKGLAAKGETDEELSCLLDVMMEKAVRIRPDTKSAIDVCGTGGDMHQTFNISTAAAFVAAAAGCMVAKHGNRSTSGVSGSADIFESIGYDIRADPSKISEILSRHNICFMFAQQFHPAMQHVAAARKMLGIRTAFNLLGPLANPAGVTRQIVGVSSADLLYRIPRILLKRGALKIMTVMSNDGMDELSTSSASSIVITVAPSETIPSHLRFTSVHKAESGLVRMTVRPEDVGLHRSEGHEIRVKSKKDAVKAFVDVLDGTAGRAMSETVVLNAAGALLVADVADGIDEAVEICTDVIAGGKTSEALDRFVSDSGDHTMLEEIRSDR